MDLRVPLSAAETGVPTHYREMTGRILLPLLVTMLLAGPARADEPGLAPVECWFPVPAGHAAKCYHFTVPESRDGGNRRLLTLPVAVIAGSGTPHHDDPIFYLTGGPRLGGRALSRRHGGVVALYRQGAVAPGARPGPDGPAGCRLAQLKFLDCPEIAAVGLQLLKLSGDEAAAQGLCRGVRGVPQALGRRRLRRSGGLRQRGHRRRFRGAAPGARDRPLEHLRRVLWHAAGPGADARPSRGSAGGHPRFRPIRRRTISSRPVAPRSTRPSPRSPPPARPTRRAARPAPTSSAPSSISSRATTRIRSW